MLWCLRAKHMISFQQKIVFAIFGLFLLPLSTLAQSKQAIQIRIVSSWGGLGTPAQNELLITRTPTGYYSHGKKIEAQLITNLVDALNSPAISKIDLANLGVTQAWLDANAERGVREYADNYFSSAAPNLQALYLSTFKNLRLMNRLLPSLYRSRWTDDYPLVEIEVTKRDGSKVVATSEAQQIFMLPWQVKRGRLKSTTYNANISRMLAALLPTEFVNRERLSAKNLNHVLAEAVMREIEDKWELLDAENQAGKYLQALRQTFLIESAEVNSYHSVDFGEEWVNGDSGVQNLQVTLKRKDLPRNLQIRVVLPYKNGEVDGLNAFWGNVDRYLNLVLSQHWLNRLMRSQATMNFELRFVGERSFSHKAMKIFAADMTLKHKEFLVKEIEAVQSEVVLLAVGWKYSRDYWLLLPDKRIVLWRFDTYGSPIKWGSLEPSAWECSNYQGRCIGAVISEDGKLVRQ